MIVKLISLCVVRMAVRRSSFDNHWTFAVSSAYHPALNHDGTFIHGHCVIAEKP